MHDLTTQPWMTYAEDLAVELQQCADEGKDISTLPAQLEVISQLPAPQRELAAAAFLDLSYDLPIKPDFAFVEPNELDLIRRLAPDWGAGQHEVAVNPVLADKLLGAWQGRIAGCLLGKPVESWTRERIVGLNQATGNWPITTYMRSDHSERIRQKFGLDDISPLSGEHNAWLNLIACAPVDDDTNYTVLALLAVEEFGRNITSEQIGYMWLNHLPILQTFTSERISYRNMTARVLPPRSGQMRNIYREYIGAQIRADFWGFINPGAPAQAAEMAYWDAALSHVKNGIYGEMWAAAMISAAFASSDPLEILQTGLAHIPQTSRLHAALTGVLANYNEGTTFESWLEALHRRWDENNFYHWAHTIPNAEIVAAVLLFGELDYTKCVGLAVSAGFDTDCNAATIGSLVGAVIGAANIPPAWTVPLNDRLLTSVRGAQDCVISDLAARTLALLPG